MRTNKTNDMCEQINTSVTITKLKSMHNIQTHTLSRVQLDLIGTNVFAIVHADDHRALHEQLMPRTCMLGKYGELLIPEEPDGQRNIALTLAKERRSFVLRSVDRKLKLTTFSSTQQYLVQFF